MICKGDYLNSSTTLKTPNSQIIIVNCCDDSTVKKTTTESNFDNVTKPDDDLCSKRSPSLVNLAELVEHNENLVPLSSWERSDRRKSDSNLSTQFTNLHLEEINSDNNDNKVDDCGERLKYRRRSSLARRISNFFRKHWRRSKTLPEPHDYQPDDEKTTMEN